MQTPGQEISECDIPNSHKLQHSWTIYDQKKFQDNKNVKQGYFNSFTPICTFSTVELFWLNWAKIPDLTYSHFYFFFFHLLLVELSMMDTAWRKLSASRRTRVAVLNAVSMYVFCFFVNLSLARGPGNLQKRNQTRVRGSPQLSWIFSQLYFLRYWFALDDSFPPRIIL